MSDATSTTIDGEPTLETRTPPGPDGLPFVGSTLSIGRDPLGFAQRIREYGDLVGYEAFGTEFVAVFDPEVVETVLVSRSDVFCKGEYETEFGELIAPEGVVFTEGERWRRQRTLLQSAFTPDRIRSYGEDVVAEATALVEGWDDGEVLDLREPVSTFTLRVLTRTLFDLEVDDDRAETVRRATRTLSTYAAPRGVALRSILPSWLPTPTERTYERSMADLDDLVMELVAQRRDSDLGGDDLLSTLAAAEYPDGTRMSPETVRDQLVTFLFAGHETSATALTVACWLVAGDDAVRDRLESELETVLAGAEPTIADLSDLEYTEAVVREAMRLYPPVVATYREPLEDMTLGGYHVPAGTTVQLSIYGIHRDGRWWDEPETFRPERWLGDRERPEYAYFPFGGGPRHCLGMRFAMTELQLALATIVERADLERVTTDLEPSVKVTLDPGEAEVRVRKR